MTAPSTQAIRAAIGEDLCQCKHVASAHLDDGLGPCLDCRSIGPWGELMRCHSFRWDYTWRPPASAAR